MPFGHRALSLNFDRNLTNFFLTNQIATALEAVFVSNLFEISPFIIRLKKKTKKTVVFAFKKYLYKTTTFANCVVFDRYVNNVLFFWIEYEG